MESMFGSGGLKAEQEALKGLEEMCRWEGMFWGAAADAIFFGGWGDRDVD